jgi:hypothetical protein
MKFSGLNKIRTNSLIFCFFGLFTNFFLVFIQISFFKLQINWKIFAKIGSKRPKSKENSYFIKFCYFIIFCTTNSHLYCGNLPNPCKFGPLSSFPKIRKEFVRISGNFYQNSLSILFRCLSQKTLHHRLFIRLLFVVFGLFLKIGDILFLQYLVVCHLLFQADVYSIDSILKLFLSILDWTFMVGFI